MRTALLARLGALLLLASISAVSLQPASLAGAQDTQSIYLPIISNPRQAYIVNHLNTDVTAIPGSWINAAKQLIIHYAHTSYGSQITTGLNWLEATRGSLYNVDIEQSGDPHIPDDLTALRIYDGTAGETYVEPEDYWYGEDGKDLTRQVAGTSWFDISTWTWCGQVSTYADDQINEYLNAVSGFEAEFPNTRFILTTGHTDDQYPESTTRHNNMIRSYALANNMILFDFADIEEYDPLGNPIPADQIDDSCPWCQGFCDNNPDYCADFDADFTQACRDGGHTHPLMCSLKAQAYWYLMARLAGWNP